MSGRGGGGGGAGDTTPTTDEPSETEDHTQVQVEDLHTLQSDDGTQVVEVGEGAGGSDTCTQETSVEDWGGGGDDDTGKHGILRMRIVTRTDGRMHIATRSHTLDEKKLNPLATTVTTTMVLWIASLYTHSFALPRRCHPG